MSDPGTFARVRAFGGKFSGWCQLRINSVVAAAALLALAASAKAGEPEGGAPKGAAEWLGLAAGSAATAEAVLAADMASLFETGAPIRVLPMLGDSGEDNIALLTDQPHVDIAFVSSDALAAAEAARKDISGRVDLVARLYPQEVHLLARADIRTIADLGGKKVSFGPAGSASSVTGAALFKALDIEAEPESLDASLAIEKLKQGLISAAVIVSGKPTPLIEGIPADSGLHLLAVPFGAALQQAYLPTRIEAADYPNLIDPGDEVPTVATGMLLLAAKNKNDPGSAARIARFVDTLFPRFAELQAPGRHPKWREVNLAATLPGFARTPEAESWLAARSAMTPKPIAATSGSTPPRPAHMTGGAEQNEKLFRKFIEWRRTSAN